MYQKIARIGPISFGFFIALFVLLTVIVIALFGTFVLPMISMGENAPSITIFQTASEYAMAMTASQDGMIQLAISVGFFLLGCFIIGLVLAILYNLTAFLTGGIKVKVQEVYDE